MPVKNSNNSIRIFYATSNFDVNLIINKQLVQLEISVLANCNNECIEKN
jgi:hypothetical protein